MGPGAEDLRSTFEMDWGVPRVPSPQRPELYRCSGHEGGRPHADTRALFFPQLHNAANANQKEKYEADLKKEIKKLQVRGPGVWISGSRGQREQGGGPAASAPVS